MAGRFAQGVCLLLLAILMSGCAAFGPAEAAAPRISTLTLTPTYPAAAASETPAAAVSPTPAQPDPSTPAAVEAEPTLSAQTPTLALTAPARPPFDAQSWETLPVLPEINQRARAILADGLARGANPHAFSKVGDCESQTTWFLGDFDLGERYYNLGAYESELGAVLPYYAGSFERASIAAKQGFTAASLFSPLWTDRERCEKNEPPLACEYRLHRPAAAFIMLGTNDAVNPKTFEGHMRKVIEFSLEQGVLPILGTKADNREGNHLINQTIARLAYEYDLPLWNFWRAVQGLPGRGLQEDGSHLTYAAPFFDRPAALKSAWPVRNLNALQILEQVMQATRQ